MFAYCLNNPIMGTDPTGEKSTDWKTQAAIGTTLVIIGIAILLAAPTGGSSLAFGALAISSSTALAAGGAAAITGTIMTGDAVAKAAIQYSKKSRQSGKERATDKPSWVSRNNVDSGKSAQQNASDMLNNKYGSGNWKKGPGTEYNQIVKWINRGLNGIALLLLERLLEDK